MPDGKSYCSFEHIISIAILYLCTSVHIYFFLLQSKSKSSHFINPFIFPQKFLNICHLNINHILPKLSEIGYLLLEPNANTDVLCLTETFLSSSINDKELNINGYNLNWKDRHGKNGGGLLIYTSKLLTCLRRDDLEIEDVESIWLELVYSNQKPILISCVYRPPNSNAEWVSKFEQMLTNADFEGKEILILGDFNIDLSANTIPSKWSHLKNIFGLTQLINVPTRVTSTSATLVDHIYSNDPDNAIFVSVPKYAISDHYPICISHKRGIKGRVAIRAFFGPWFFLKQKYSCTITYYTSFESLLYEVY